MVHCFTSITLAYLPRARVLAESVRRHHPDWRLHLLLVDRVPDWLTTSDAHFDEIHTLDDLEIPGGAGWLFAHDVVEACTAVKGALLARLLERDDTAAVVYLDPDIVVFAPIVPVVEALRHASVILTPHLLEPETTALGVLENERTALAHGTFNLGFLAVAADEDGHRFAQWWRDRLIDHCFDDRMAGLFTDQRWCDLVPSMFVRHAIIRDAGCNMAPWNAGQRALRFEHDVPVMGDGALLRFFHFSGWDAPGRQMLEAHGASPAVFELWDWYGGQLEAAGQAELGATPWAFGVFEDGTPIDRPMRVAYRSMSELRRRFRDPFRSAMDSYLTWWRSAGKADWG